MRATALVDDDLAALLARLGHAKTFVIVDACNSGTSSDRAVIPTDKSLRTHQEKFLHLPGMTPRRPASATKGFGQLDFDFSKEVALHRRTRAEAGLVFLAAALDSQYAQASAQGSVFTLGLIAEGEQSKAQKRPLTARGMVTTAKGFIAEHFRNEKESIHVPVATGDQAMLDLDLRKNVVRDCGDCSAAWRALVDLQAGRLVGRS